MFIFKNSISTDVGLVKEPDTMLIFEKEQVEIKNQIKPNKRNKKENNNVKVSNSPVPNKNISSRVIVSLLRNTIKHRLNIFKVRRILWKFIRA